MAGNLRGMLLGGAVGDALGAPVEFLSWSEIQRELGPAGVTEFVGGFAPAGSITDDTQMTLFVFEGLIRAQLRWLDRGLCHPPSVIRNALLRWGATQGIEPCADERHALNGWLFEQQVLHSRRGPGMTCLSAVAAIADGTDVVPAANDSKGCGTVMRSAPFAVCNESRAYELAAESSAYTHGNDIAAACAMLAEAQDEGSNEDRFVAGVRLAVNHFGDSDSTGAIAGNLLGARYGAGAIPTRWLRQLEARDVIEELVSAWETASNLPSMDAWLLADDDGGGDTSLRLQRVAATTREQLYARFPPW